jgi:hypothetical protein
MCTDIFELDETEVADVRDSVVSRFDRDDKLHQLHRFWPEQIHRRTASSSCYSCLRHFLSLPLLSWTRFLSLYLASHRDWLRFFMNLFTGLLIQSGEIVLFFLKKKKKKKITEETWGNRGRRSRFSSIFF